MKHYAYLDVQKARIEIIPMIDIMMFLLVFFIMITLTMIAGSGIPMDLPQATTAQQLDPTKITIGVTKDSTMYVDGRVVDRDSLSARLKSDFAADKKLEVVIEGDKSVSLQTLLNVMDIARGVGISAVAIVAKAGS